MCRVRSLTLLVYIYLPDNKTGRGVYATHTCSQAQSERATTRVDRSLSWNTHHAGRLVAAIVVPTPIGIQTEAREGAPTRARSTIHICALDVHPPILQLAGSCLLAGRTLLLLGDSVTEQHFHGTHADPRPWLSSLSILSLTLCIFHPVLVLSPALSSLTPTVVVAVTCDRRRALEDA